MRFVGRRTRIGACMLLLLSHALLLYALSYGGAHAVRWQREEASPQRAVFALPSDSFVAAATQRVEPVQPLQVSFKTWWAPCISARCVVLLVVARASRIEASSWRLPQPLAVRAGEVLRL